LSKQQAALVLYNANVLTLNRERPRAGLVGIGDGKIVWVGGNDDLHLFRGRAKLVDCEGRTVAPGFNDAHIHLMSLASRLFSVDCSPASVASISDIEKAIGRHAGGIPRGTWIRASGYNEFYLSERRHPNRKDLDRAAPDHPVKLTHRSQHACVLNSLALRLAGISIETPDPPGGMIDRELDTGEPSGLLFGMNSYLNEQVVPSLSDDELEEGVRSVSRTLISLGMTSVQDASVSNGYEEWRTFLALKDSGSFAPRVSMMFGSHALDEFIERGLSAGYGDRNIKVGPMKLTLDETRGHLNPPKDELNEAVLRAHQAGYQVAMHAVEEGTVEAAVTALESCLGQSPKSGHRHRLEHCSVCPPGMMHRLSAVRAVVVTQPAFVYYNGERYLSEVPGSQLPWLYRTASFFKSGLSPAASSDGPVVPCDPLVGIYAAVTRKAETGQVLSPEEAVAPGMALEMYASNGAYASFDEDSKGSIEVGKLADLVVLSGDPTAVPPEEIPQIHAEKTIIGGRLVWER
jgi:predicted amidohydrolase YtcJ